MAYSVHKHGGGRPSCSRRILRSYIVKAPGFRMIADGRFSINHTQGIVFPDIVDCHAVLAAYRLWSTCKGLSPGRKCYQAKAYQERNRKKSHNRCTIILEGISGQIAFQVLNGLQAGVGRIIRSAASVPAVCLHLVPAHDTSRKGDRLFPYSIFRSGRLSRPGLAGPARRIS